MATKNFLFQNAADLRDLVDLNDELKRLYKGDTSMVFPSIVVVGDQSHGKTSLIENITNLNLPRGTGIQTRVPTEIQLRNSVTPQYTISYRPIGDTSYKTIDFSEENLEDKLRMVQREVTGSDTGISEDTITLTIERPDLLPLTITDLPGFIFQRVDDGDDNAEISEKMRQLYRKFIAPEQNVVVCVLNAVNDIETSAVLKMCLELDEKRNRTLVVVTKIDLRPGDGFKNYRNAAKKFRIKKMFFTRNKTDEERIARTPSDVVRETERRFIAGHKELSNFEEDSKGVLALRNYLVDLQKDLILPSIMANFKKIAEILELQLSELDKISVSIDSPEQCKAFIMEKIDAIFSEINRLYNNISTSVKSDNYAVNSHTENQYGVFELFIPRKKLTIRYTVSELDGQTQIMFERGVKEVIYAEVFMSKTKKAVNCNVDLEMPEPIVIPPGEFELHVRLLSDKDFQHFKERIDSLFTTFGESYGLDYFISEEFINIYEIHEQAINTTNNLPDRDFSQLAENILFKDIIPKVKYEVEEFRDFAVDFAHRIFIVRINEHFGVYPNLRALLVQNVEKKLKLPVGVIHEFIEVLLENAFKTSTTDKMYLYKVSYLKKQFKDNAQTIDEDFCKSFCGGIDIQDMKDIYLSNKKIYKNALRVWAYISNIFPPLKDNLIKAIHNSLLQKIINTLGNDLRAIFDNQFFQNHNEIAHMLKQKPELARKKDALRANIIRIQTALARIKDMPKKYPNLQGKFSFIQDGRIDDLLLHSNIKIPEGEVPVSDYPPKYAQSEVYKKKNEPSIAKITQEEKDYSKKSEVDPRRASNVPQSNQSFDRKTEKMLN